MSCPLLGLGICNGPFVAAPLDIWPVIQAGVAGLAVGLVAKVSGAGREGAMAALEGKEALEVTMEEMLVAMEMEVEMEVSAAVVAAGRCHNCCHSSICGQSRSWCHTIASLVDGPQWPQHLPPSLVEGPQWRQHLPPA